MKLLPYAYLEYNFGNNMPVLKKIGSKYIFFFGRKTPQTSLKFKAQSLIIFEYEFYVLYVLVSIFVFYECINHIRISEFTVR